MSDRRPARSCRASASDRSLPGHGAAATRGPLLAGELDPEHKPARPGLPTGFGRPSSNCLEGHPSVETIAELAPRPDELIVSKRWYDAFAGTSLDGALRARGVTSLVVTGTLTDICRAGHGDGRVQPGVPHHGGGGRGRHALARDPARQPGHHWPSLRACRIL